ncbi:hypothetical protein ACKKBG_A21880 [Auxenochlorella protothecoides x Auxenochlorella symbiontica]
MAGTETGATAVIRGARDAGIEVCFANPGTSEMHFVSALDQVPGIRAVLGLHETVCTGAADGYGRMAGKPAMALLHLGPGLANGLANLHNARRARTPTLALVGDMATWHQPADAVLAMDIDSLARTVSEEVHRAGAGGEDFRHLAERAAEARGVTTLVVPHDVSWTRVPAPEDGVKGGGREGSGPGAAPAPPPGTEEFVRDLAAAMRAASQGRLGIYCGGKALIDDEGALRLLGQIAAASGADLLCENSFARVDRGHGLPKFRRVPYFPQEASAALGKYETLVLVDARRPVANFGYEGGPSQLVTQSEEAVWEIDGDAHIGTVLKLLGMELQAGRIVPFKNCGGVFAGTSRPLLPTGRLTAAAMCATIAALQPEGAIVVDEALTSGTAYWEASSGCPQFSHLTLTGGAIGAGIPMAVGAAMACPARRVINIQADGSGLYSAQGLWTQAREKLNVLTIVCANRTYAILKLELAKQRIAPSNGPAARSLTDLGHPNIYWVALATGYGVPAVQAGSCEELARQIGVGLARDGPMLIEALL